MNHSTSGLPVHHQLQEFTQTHVHRVSDAIWPSHPLSSPSSLAPSIRVFSNESTLILEASIWRLYSVLNTVLYMLFTHSTSFLLAIIL